MLSFPIEGSAVGECVGAFELGVFSASKWSDVIFKWLLTFEYEDPSLSVRETIILFLGTITLGLVDELPRLDIVDPYDSLRFIPSD